MTPVEALYIEHLLGLASDSATIARAREILVSIDVGDSVLDVAELASLAEGSPRHAEEVGMLLRRAVYASNSDFDERSADARSHAHLAFLALCRRGLGESCRPYDIYNALLLIESHFDFPAWLEDLFDYCDWTEPETRWADVRHLQEYLVGYVSRAEELGS